MGSISLDLAELADSLAMAEGMPGRRSRDGCFSRAEKARLIRIGSVLERAQRLFGDRARGLEWLLHHNRALSFASPISQLDTSAGTKRVLALLGRIDAGHSLDPR